MPNIEQFEAGSGEVRASEGGQEAFVQEGRRVGAFYHQMGQDAKQLADTYEQHQTDQEISNLYKTSVDLKANGLQTWNQVIAQPGAAGRPDLAEKYLQQYGQAVDTWASHAQTRQGQQLAQRMGAQLKEEMFNRTAADQSDLMGVAAKQNLEHVQNGLAAATMDDPSSASANLGLYEKAVQDMIPSQVQGPERARLTDELLSAGQAHIATSGYLAAIERGRQQIAAGTPATALDQVTQDIAAQKNFQYLPPEVQEQLPRRVDEARRSGQEQAQAGVRAQNEQLKLEGQGVFTQINGEITDYERRGLTPPAQVYQQIADAQTKYGTVIPAEIATLQAHGNQAIKDVESREFVQTDERTYANFSQRISIAQGQPGALSEQELSQAQLDGKLSHQAYDRLHQSLEAASKDPLYAKGYEHLNQWLDTVVRPQLTKSAAVSANPTLPDGSPNFAALTTSGRSVDPQGDVAFGEARREAQEIFDSWVHQGGKTPDQALDIMTNPNNPMNLLTGRGRLAYWQAAKSSGNATGYFQTHPYAINAPAIGNQVSPSSQAGVDMAHRAAIVRAQQNPIKPGESAAAYLQRIGQ